MPPPKRPPEVLAADAEWFLRTGHCGQCGQPGDYCLCTSPCGCSGLHERGSGRAEDALEAFMDSPVSDDQESLFG